MPTIGRFYAIVIACTSQIMRRRLSTPSARVKRRFVAIADGEILRGALPDRALRMVREWASMHRGELATNWDRVQGLEHPAPIAPLP